MSEDVQEAARRLHEAEEQQRREQLGPALDWDDEALDNLAQIGPADIAAAEALWKRDAPPKLRGLIDATPADEESTAG